MKYLLTSKYCPHCEEERKKHKAEIEKGEVVELSVESKKGKKLADALNLREVPVLVECSEGMCDVLE